MMSRDTTRTSSSLTSPTSVPTKKGTVLMIHGWAQNAVVMNMKTRGLTKKLKQAGYDCVFLEGPHLLPLTSIVQVDGVPVKIENGTRENARAWFLYSEDDPADATLSQSKIKMRYKGLEESLDVIHRALDACAGKVGVFGFSQGAVFVHLLLAHPPFFDRIKYGIMASGFPAQNLCDSEASHQRMVDVPTLHLIGRNDTSVAPKHSQELVDLFKNAVVLWHDKGHIIPQQSEQCYTIISFLDLVLGLR